MKAYTGFASVYDRFMDNVDYKIWCNYLKQLLKKHGAFPEGNVYQNNIVLDLGCGTGNVTEELAEAGYDMIGVDASEDMLQIAMEKNKGNILYLLQDMRSFELYGTVEAVVSLGDSINYITEYDDLVKVFKLVNNYLDPNGVFIFDLKMEPHFLQIGDATIAEDREECSFIWENHYDKAEKINEYGLSIFVRDEDGRYDKFMENHYQKVYGLIEIKNALNEAGLCFDEAYEALTEKPADDYSSRIYIVAREHGKSVQ